jgi:cobyrinic acid a,c-diamide synthase
MTRNLPRVVIAAPHSGSGKTTFTLGLLAALRRRGLAVQPFKAGPDFIDPSHHTAICGRVSRNLDTWMCERATVAEIFERSARDADISVVEGVMGLYDGFGPDEERGSTAHLAKLLAAPVVLVIDAARMATSAAAVALGLQQFDRDVTIAGVVFNNVGSEGHYEWLREALEARTGLASFGYLGYDPALRIEERHLGLVPAAEAGIGDAARERLRSEFDRHVDLERILAAAGAAPSPATATSAVFRPRAAAKPVRVGVARDAALNFYYQENIDLLECLGAEIVPFSILDDPQPPPGVHGIYLGGGFPEIFAGRIAANMSMRRGMRDFFASGGAIYAECGGLMILCDALVDLDGRRHEMFGLVPATSVMRRDRLSLGYVDVETLEDTLIARAGARYRAQTFHHSVLEDVRFTPALKLYHGAKASFDGCAERNLFATYVHAHFAAQPGLAERFVERCRGGAVRAH